MIFVNLFNNFGAISKFQLIMGLLDRLMGLLFWVFVSVNLIKFFSWYVTHCSYDRIKLIQCRTFIKHTIPLQQNSLLSKQSFNAKIGRWLGHVFSFHMMLSVGGIDMTNPLWQSICKKFLKKCFQWGFESFLKK